MKVADLLFDCRPAGIDCFSSTSGPGNNRKIYSNSRIKARKATQMQDELEKDSINWQGPRLRTTASANFRGSHFKKHNLKKGIAGFDLY